VRWLRDEGRREQERERGRDGEEERDERPVIQRGDWSDDKRSDEWRAGARIRATGIVWYISQGQSQKGIACAITTTGTKKQ
jgi:hypothetical protein